MSRSDPRPNQPRYPVPTAALRAICEGVTLSAAARMIGIHRHDLRKLLEGHLPRKRPVAERVHAAVQRLQKPLNAVEIITSGLNARANFRISVDSSKPGLGSRYTVLRYPLHGCRIDQRYDVADDTLLVSRLVLRHLLTSSPWIEDAAAVERELEENGLIERISAEKDLGKGSGKPAQLVSVYKLDLTLALWANLKRLCEASAARPDPGQDGVVRYRSYRDAVD